MGSDKGVDLYWRSVGFQRLTMCNTHWDHTNLLVRSLSGEKMGSERKGGWCWREARGVAIKALIFVGGVLVFKRLTRCNTRWDHTNLLVHSLCGEKCSKDQASEDPDSYFNLRMFTCPAAEMNDGSKVLYMEQAFSRTPHKPFRQRFVIVKPCPKEMKSDVQIGFYAIRDVEEYKNFCDRSQGQRPLPEEVIGDVEDHLTTVYLKCCEHGGRRCIYEGSTPPDGFPTTWNGATRFVSEVTVLRSHEVHMWDRGYSEGMNQVWGSEKGPYEFKPA